MNKLCFIITTFQRDKLLYKSVESLLPYLNDNSIIIVDQGEMTEEKENWLNDNNFDSINYSRKNNCQQLFYYQVPYNSGLSYGRNFGVKKAKESGCDYVYISSDSFLMNNSILRLNNLIDNNLFGYDIIGNELVPSVCGWEGKLQLVENFAFVLDFIDKKSNPDFIANNLSIWNVDIMRNCFIAKINTLINTPWDENFRLAEHEDEFYRLKLAGTKCGWTKDICLTKQTDRPIEYDRLRNTNFNEGIKYLKQKWGIKGWVKYLHLERAKEFYKGE
jgi:hypothetical protein